jgi:hypothetical protein
VSELVPEDPSLVVKVCPTDGEVVLIRQTPRLAEIMGVVEEESEDAVPPLCAQHELPLCDPGSDAPALLAAAIRLRRDGRKLGVKPRYR